LENVAAAHPDLWLIVSDVGYREMRRLCGVLDRQDRMVLCTANLSGHLALEYLVERFGAHRVVFGTGHPVRDPGEAVTRLLWSELSDDDVRAVGGDTMRRLLASSRPALEAR
jgi:predicted TIM-barrel fold metal-dependent hydrolase